MLRFDFGRFNFSTASINSNMLEQIIIAFSDVNLISNLLLITFVVVFFYLFGKENNNKKSPLRWIDMLLDKETERLSLSRFGQFWGIAISSWIIVSISQRDEWKDVFPLLFPVYLAFIAGTYSYSKYVSMQNQHKNHKDHEDHENRND